MRKFVAIKTKELRNKSVHNVINDVKKRPEIINDLLDSWTNAYSKEHAIYQSRNDKNDDDI